MSEGIPGNHPFFDLLKFFPQAKAGKTDKDFPVDETAHELILRLRTLPNIDVPVYYNGMTKDNLAIILNDEIAVLYDGNLKRISSILASGRPIIRFGSAKKGVRMIQLSQITRPMYYQNDKVILELTTAWLAINWLKIENEAAKVERIVCYTKETQCQPSS